MTTLTAPVYRPAPGRCGAALYDRGPSCLAEPARLFACGWRCQAHDPSNYGPGGMAR